MKYLSLIIIAVLSLSQVACLSYGSREYDKTVQNIEILAADSHNIDFLKPLKVNVSSNKTWQKANLFIESGDVVSIKAHGRWSPWPDMNLWSGPEGSYAWAGEVKSIRGSALMARLGHKGQPFEVAIEKSFKAKDYGMLYFAMNDPFDYLHDNQGQVSAEVYIDRLQSQKQSSKAHNGFTVISYQYDDQKRQGRISASVGENSFAVRKWLLHKIGEIAASKNVAIKSSKSQVEGGAYRVMDENIDQGVLSIQFETVW